MNSGRGGRPPTGRRRRVTSSQPGDLGTQAGDGRTAGASASITAAASSGRRPSPRASATRPSGRVQSGGDEATTNVSPPYGKPTRGCRRNKSAAVAPPPTWGHRETARREMVPRSGTDQRRDRQEERASGLRRADARQPADRHHERRLPPVRQQIGWSRTYPTRPSQGPATGGRRERSSPGPPVTTLAQMRCGSSATPGPQPAPRTSTALALPRRATPRPAAPGTEPPGSGCKRRRRQDRQIQRGRMRTPRRPPQRVGHHQQQAGGREVRELRASGSWAANMRRRRGRLGQDASSPSPTQRQSRWRGRRDQPGPMRLARPARPGVTAANSWRSQPVSGCHAARLEPSAYAASSWPNSPADHGAPDERSSEADRRAISGRGVEPTGRPDDRHGDRYAAAVTAELPKRPPLATSRRSAAVPAARRHHAGAA